MPVPPPPVTTTIPGASDGGEDTPQAPAGDVGDLIDSVTGEAGVGDELEDELEEVAP